MRPRPSLPYEILHVGWAEPNLASRSGYGLRFSFKNFSFSETVISLVN
jgi:hypothetical protein